MEELSLQKVGGMSSGAYVKFGRGCENAVVRSSGL